MRHKTLRRTAVVAVCALIITALPVTAGAAPHKKVPNKDGSIPARWNIAAPRVPVRSDDSTPLAAGGDGDGTNALSFAHFDDGDMICAFPGTTFTGHTGIWKESLYYSPLSRCVWSANTSPSSGVQRETAAKYRTYDCAYGLWVPSEYAHGASVVNWCATHLGEPYEITSAKSDYTSWYCSKLAWAGWKVKAGVDLDGNGGYWVKPADLVNDPQTATFAYSD